MIMAFISKSSFSLVNETGPRTIYIKSLKNLLKFTLGWLYYYETSHENVIAPLPNQLHASSIIFLSAFMGTFSTKRKPSNNAQQSVLFTKFYVVLPRKLNCLLNIQFLRSYRKLHVLNDGFIQVLHAPDLEGV